jgi:alpha-tubulin suppressor-like RCC1 family protein
MVDGTTELYGVGRNPHGELCNLVDDKKLFRRMDTEPLTSRVKQVSCSHFDTTVLLENGDIYSTGQMCNANHFTKINTDKNIVQIYSSFYSVFGLSEQGEIFMCNQEENHHMVRLPVELYSNVSELVAGGYHFVYKSK